MMLVRNAERFDNLQAATMYPICPLEGDALAQLSVYMSNRNRLQFTAHHGVSVIQEKAYGDANHVVTGEHPLQGLSQENRDFHTDWAEFQPWATKRMWNDKVKISHPQGGPSCRSTRISSTTTALTHGPNWQSSSQISTSISETSRTQTPTITISYFVRYSSFRSVS